jgi:putative MATE family efflux protein
MPDPLTAVGTGRAMWRLALPVLAEESLTMLVGWTDWWLAGHFLHTADHKAAMGLLTYLLWLLASLFAAVAIGAMALVARSIGAADTHNASQVTNQALLCGLALAAVLTLGAWLCGQQICGWLQLRGQPAELVWQYLRIIIPAIPFIMLSQVGTACLHGAGDTVSGCLAKGLVNLVNMTVSPMLLLGIGPAPELGWEGLAVGTASAYVLGGSLILIMLVRRRAGLTVTWSQMRPDRELIRRLLRIGLPGGIDVALVVLCHLVYVSVINSLGTMASAAHGLALQIEAMSYLPSVAFHVAAATLAGQYLGAGDGRRASRGVLLTCLVGCAVAFCAAVLFFFAGGWLTTFFTGDRDDPAGRLAAGLLKIVALSTPSLAVMSILTGGLRGAGDTRWPLAITFIGLLGIRIPGACLLAWDEFVIPGTSLVVRGWGWGVEGTWWAMNSDVILRSVLLAIRFFHGGWRTVRV